MEIDRTSYIGSSDCAAILGVSPWKTAFMCYQQKIGAYVDNIDPARQKLFDRGKRFEPIITSLMIEELQDRGHDVQIIALNKRYRDPDYPFLASEIDAELLIDGEEVNAEIKSVNGFAAKHWGNPESDEIPIYYAAQVQHAFMIKPRKRCVVAALIGTDDLRIHWVDHDPEIVANIRSLEIDFWERVQNRIAPDPESIADVKWLYGKDAGKVIDANSDILIELQELKELKQQSKLIENKIELNELQIKKFMKDAAILQWQGRPLATWKNNKPSVKINWEKAVRELSKETELPSIIKQYSTEVTGARPFNIKK